MEVGEGERGNCMRRTRGHRGDFSELWYVRMDYEI